MAFFVFVMMFSLSAGAPSQALFPDRIKEERSNATCGVAGTIPTWLDGYFVRQTCGGFGNTTGGQTSPPSRIEHMFDCMGMVSTFTFSAGAAVYSNRNYPTHAFKVWEHYDFDLDRSKVAWPQIFSHFDAEAAAHWANNFTEAEGYYGGSPTVDFWKLGDRHEAVTESTYGLHFELPSLDMRGPFPFNDSFDVDANYINNPAHAAVDGNGSYFSSVGKFSFTSHTTGEMKLVLYAVNGEERTEIGVKDIGTFDLTKCASFDAVYPDNDDMLGYMHSFGITDNYIILPMTSLAFNYCGMFLPRPADHAGDPVFFRTSRYVSSKKGRFLVFDRRTNEFVGDIAADPFLAMHQANWFERDGHLIGDMTTFDYNIYETLTIKNVLEGFPDAPFRSKFVRYTLDTNDWSLSSAPLLPQETLEFPRINEEYLTRPYSMVYMLNNPWQEGSYVLKYNLDTKETKQWGPFPGVYPGEPVFVPRPSSSAEDDGVVIVGGVEEKSRKGFVAVLDGRTLTELGRAWAPDLTPFGLHNRFYAN